VRVLPLARQGSAYVAPEPDAFIDGRYPLARPLYIYINKPPGQPLSPLVREFLNLVLSRDGQALVLNEGYTPLPVSVIRRQLRMIANAD
jgi:phosphate transport system substrate-binding protein